MKRALLSGLLAAMVLGCGAGEDIGELGRERIGNLLSDEIRSAKCGFVFYKDGKHSWQMTNIDEQAAWTVIRSLKNVEQYSRPKGGHASIVGHTARVAVKFRHAGLEVIRFHSENVLIITSRPYYLQIAEPEVSEIWTALEPYRVICEEQHKKATEEADQ